MKRIKEPRVTSTAAGIMNQAGVQKVHDEQPRPSTTAELGPIQKDRSYLPASSDKPVHKCGCT